MEDFFGPNGILKNRLSSFEYRRQQELLAEKIDDFICGSGSILAAEAPTGVGKTYAMLVPAILWAEKNTESVLILTSGITLQEQLVQKDIPELLKVTGIDLPYSLLKGRNNYVCLRKARGISVNGFLDFEGDKGQASRDIAEWLYSTKTGDLSELNLSDGHPARELIASSYNTCMGAMCPFKDLCFYFNAIKEASKSRLIVANYHVFFSYVLGQGKPFPVHCGLILCDEAHKMAEAARSATQISISSNDLDRLIRNAPSMDKFDKAILKGAGFKRGASFTKKAEDISLRSAELFDQLVSEIPNGKGFSDVSDEVRQACSALLEKCDALHDSMLRLEETFEPSESKDEQETQNKLHIWNVNLSEFKDSIRWCCEPVNFPNWAYWRDGNSIKSSCVAVSEVLPNAFEADGAAKVVALSATMAVDGSFDYWSNETGLAPDDTIVLDSPFDLPKQMGIVILDVGSEVKSPEYPDRVARACRKFAQINKGATLILLSSRRLLNAVSEYMKDNSQRDKLNILTQGDLPRSELLRQFKETKRSVLIGMASFREGIDVPGEALTQVIIDRIPFRHPDDPIGVARSKIEGRRCFVDVSLPEAKMQLRQAAGRLIRTNKDSGRIVIMDERVFSRRSWKILKSLPQVPCYHAQLTGFKNP